MINSTFYQRKPMWLMVAAMLFVLLAVSPFLRPSIKGQTPKNGELKTKSKGPQSEGITVHGHWQIEVKNADGTSVTRREFDNALTRNGGGMFTLLLSRDSNAGKWAILLRGTGFLLLEEPGADFPMDFPTRTKTLVVSTPPPAQVQPPPPYTLVLTGSVISPTAMDLNEVETMNWLCPSTLTAAQCAVNNPTNAVFDFTHHVLLPGTSTPPVSVAAGQYVQVTVTFSFS